MIPCVTEPEGLHSFSTMPTRSLGMYRNVRSSTVSAKSANTTQSTSNTDRPANMTQSFQVVQRIRPGRTRCTRKRDRQSLFEPEEEMTVRRRGKGREEAGHILLDEFGRWRFTTQICTSVRTLTS